MPKLSKSLWERVRVCEKLGMKKEEEEEEKTKKRCRLKVY
jgi:hypothetical protein